MKYLPLIWSNLKRKKTRTILTVLSVLVSFLLFGFLVAVDNAFTSGVDVAGADRLLVIHKVSLIQPLPATYGPRIKAVPGVEAVTFANWFGGIYQDPKNFFGQMAVDSETFLDLYPEYVLPEAQKKAWLADRAGALVGRQLADRFGFKVGDRIPIQATIYRKPDGSSLWEFNVSGIYDGAEQATDTSGLYFRYDYLNEGMGGRLGRVGWYTVRIADPARAAEVSRRIDALFANSPAETKTNTEKAFAQSFANQVGNVAAIVRWVLTAVFLIMLVVTGNTMAQAVRERTSELAVLKTLGFSNGRVLGLVLAESLAIAVLGGGLGLLLAMGLIIPMFGKALRSFLPVFFLPASAPLTGVALILLFGTAAGLLPAAQAMRLRIVDALRRV
ncbi:MAG TPA: FtsX-like permease family protein [Thermoanaerobaculia bacterium]|nr:FtsX-like permease family protein [Thermoanaerobaculia bacterium]